MARGKYVEANVENYAINNNLKQRVIFVDDGEGSFTTYYINNGGKIEILGKHRNTIHSFLSKTELNSNTPDNPTEAELQTYVTNNKIISKYFFYTGTDVETDPVLFTAIVDNNGQVKIISSNASKTYVVDGLGFIQSPKKGDKAIVKKNLGDLINTFGPTEEREYWYYNGDKWEYAARSDDSLKYINDLKYVKRPHRGKLMLITESLPRLILYVFNPETFDGIVPVDGTLGAWQPLYSDLVRTFIKSSDLNPTDKDNPTTEEFKAYVTNKKINNTFIYYNGTDDSKIEATYVYFVDKQSEILLIQKPSSLIKSISITTDEL